MVFCLEGCQTSKTAKAGSSWVKLFNGDNLEGWIAKINHYGLGDNHANTFRAEDGMIKVRYDNYQGGYNDRFGHLYYKTPYSHFHLSLEYRFTGEVYKGAPSFVKKNSGVMFHAQNPNDIGVEQNWPIALEMQFLGGLKEGEHRPTGNMCSPGTSIFYDNVKDDRHCIRSSSETIYGNDWVKAELIVLGDSLIRHVINGRAVMEYSRPYVDKRGVVKGTNSQTVAQGKPLKKGFIALQSEGQPVDFRHIKIKNLKPLFLR